MECKEAQHLVKPYIDGKIKDKDLEKFLDHIEKCGECYEELEINYTIFLALMQLDDKPDVSYNISEMLQEELSDSRKYIRRKKSLDFLRIIMIVIVIFAVLAVLSMQFNFFVNANLWMWR